MSWWLELRKEDGPMSFVRNQCRRDVKPSSYMRNRLRFASDVGGDDVW